MQTNTRERGQTQRIKKVRAVRTVLGGDCIQVAPKGAFAKADEYEIPLRQEFLAIRPVLTWSLIGHACFFSLGRR